MQKSKVKNQKDNIDLRNLKVALVVEELTQLGGAERVLDAFLEIFPQAPVYTLVWNKERTQHRYDKLDIRPSFIQKMPLATKRYKWYLPLMPWAVESFDLKNYDLVISVTSALAKGIKTTNPQIHICYCNTPTRWLWTDVASYVKAAPIPFFVRPLMPLLLWWLRRWDLKAAKRPNFMIANSQNVQKRIKKYYQRDSTVIYPMVDTIKFKLVENFENYFLLVSRIEPYKKVDLVIKAFKRLKENLKIVGSGTKKEQMQMKATKNVEFLGRKTDEELAQLYAHAKAVIFPQEEDFGIVPIEAMAAGRPVIAYKKGGALETVIPGKTGEFFFPQTAQALKKILKKFKPEKYNSAIIRKQAQKFDKTLFKRVILEYIVSKVKNQKSKIKMTNKNAKIVFSLEANKSEGDVTIFDIRILHLLEIAAELNAPHNNKQILSEELR